MWEKDLWFKCLRPSLQIVGPPAESLRQVPRMLSDSRQHQGWLRWWEKPVLCWNQWDAFAKCPTVLFVKHGTLGILFGVYIFCWHVSLLSHLTFPPPLALLTITNVFEEQVNARQPRRAFTASSACKVRKLGEEEKSICSSRDHGVITPGEVLSTAQSPQVWGFRGNEGWTLLATTGQWELWEVKYSDNSGALQGGTQPPCKSLNISPSLHYSPSSNRHKKIPRELKANRSSCLGLCVEQ